MVDKFLETFIIQIIICEQPKKSPKAAFIISTFTEYAVGINENTKHFKLIKQK